MKAVLEFDIDDPFDRLSHMAAIKALDMASALFELLHNHRDEVVRKAVGDALGEHNICLEEIIS